MADKPKRYTVAQVAAMVEAERDARLSDVAQLSRTVRLLVILVLIIAAVTWVTWKAEFGVR